MKILLLTPDLPYPSESGAAIRNFGLIRGLAAAGHGLSLLSFAERRAEPQSNPLYDLCERVQTIPSPHHSKLGRIARLLLSGRADIEFRLASEAYERRLLDILEAEAFDLIQFSGIEMGHYLPVIQSSRSEAKVIYDALNAEAELQRVVAEVDRRDGRRWPAAIYSAIQSRRLGTYESAICQTVDAIIAVSEEDSALLKPYQGAPVHLLSNGIHSADYAPPPHAKREGSQLLFSGKMDYRPNVDAVEWFCRAVFPRIREGFPGASFVVVGRNPHARVRQLAADSQITITGWVDAVQPYLHSAAIYVVPLRMGSGTRLKILQAMAAGCAVVSSSIGAAGLNEETRGALHIADGAQEFANAVGALLADEERRREMGAQAQRQVKKHYDWSALIPRLLRIYAELGLG
ncbi:MAG: glycosyltransferase [Chloroflexota bacterium]|nr:glycosyltransferase [Chloroflexota bacterium]